MDAFPIRTGVVDTFLVLCLVLYYLSCTHDLLFSLSELLVVVVVYKFV